MFPLVNQGGTWGWWQPGEGGNTFNSTDPQLHPYGGGGFVDNYGYYLGGPPPAPPAPGGDSGTAPASGAPDGSGGGGNGSFDWSTGAPRRRSPGGAMAQQGPTWQDLQSEGLWNRDTLNRISGSGGKGVDEQALADSNVFLNRWGQGYVDPSSDGDAMAAINALGGFDPEYAQWLQRQLEGTSTAMQQHMASGPDIFAKAEGEIMPAMASFFPVVGPMLAGAMRAGLADDSNSWSSMFKNMGMGALKGYVAGQVGQGITGGTGVESLDPSGLGAGDMSTIGDIAGGGGLDPSGLGHGDFDPNASAGGTFDPTGLGPGDFVPPFDPANYDWTKDSGPGTTVGARGALDPNLAGIPANLASTPETPQQPQQAQQPSKLNPEQLAKYAQTAMKIKDALGLAEKPDGAPTQAEGESQEQFTSELVQYLGIDTATMEQAGLQPGSPEYMNYILDQADSVISQVLGDLNVDSADFAAQFRAKTAEEQQQLTRALYVRGTLSQMMGSGTYADPFSGQMQEVAGPGMFNPNQAAFERGKAGQVNELAGLHGSDAMSRLQGMLGRNSGLFGMQGASDQRFEQAKRDEQQQEEMRKRRGMLNGY